MKAAADGENGGRRGPGDKLPLLSPASSPSTSAPHTLSHQQARLASQSVTGGMNGQQLTLGDAYQAPSPKISLSTAV